MPRSRALPGKKCDLNAAFRELRQAGFIARQSFECCRTCAGTQIAIDVSLKINEGMDPGDIRGSVFYCKQGGEALNETGTVTLSFGQIHTQGHGPVGEDTVKVGKAVVDVMNEAGIVTAWDGDPNRSIKVDLTTEPSVVG